MIGDCVRDARGERRVETGIGVLELDKDGINAGAIDERIGDLCALLLPRWRQAFR